MRTTGCILPAFQFSLRLLVFLCRFCAGVGFCTHRQLLSASAAWRRDVFQLVREYIIGKHQFYRGKQLLLYMIRERTFLVFTTTKIIPSTTHYHCSRVCIHHDHCSSIPSFSCIFLLEILLYLDYYPRASGTFSNRKYLRNTQYSMMIDDNSFEI